MISVFPFYWFLQDTYVIYLSFLHESNILITILGILCESLLITIHIICDVLWWFHDGSVIVLEEAIEVL